MECVAYAANEVESYLFHLSIISIPSIGKCLPPPKLDKLLAPLRVVTVGATLFTSPIEICFFPFLMIQLLHFCADVGLVENVRQHLVRHAVL